VSDMCKCGRPSNGGLYVASEPSRDWSASRRTWARPRGASQLNVRFDTYLRCQEVLAAL